MVAGVDGCRAWTAMAVLPAPVLAHAHPSPLAPVPPGALPCPPGRDERNTGCANCGFVARERCDLHAAPMISVMSALETLPPIRLTELTDCGGCAAKLGADLLADALSGLGVGPGVPAAPDDLIAGVTPPDDAAA